DKKKNTDSTAGFHQNQLESICVFYLPASFCPASFLLATYHIATAYRVIFWYNGENDFLEKV
ncbi:hypothetical protein QE521_06520, partial [Streptococcus suis]|uniref:hypothetical protein n=1 Tax=Streptococcus suis TaxID=1307 RepID=UPI0037577285